MDDGDDDTTTAGHASTVIASGVLLIFIATLVLVTAGNLELILLLIGLPLLSNVTGGTKSFEPLPLLVLLPPFQPLT